MAKYLIKASYTVEGTKGLLREGGMARQSAVEHMVEGLGGTVEAFYFGYGEADVFAIVDMPDETSAIAVSLIVNASGGVILATSPLLTAAQVDAACKRSVDYRPPGS